MPAPRITAFFTAILLALLMCSASAQSTAPPTTAPAVAAPVTAPVATPAPVPATVLADPIIPVPQPKQDAVTPYDPGQDPGGFFAKLFSATTSGQWKLLITLVLVGVVWGFRAIGGKFWPWLKTDRGGAMLALLTGVTGVLAAMALAGGAFSAQVVLNGIMAGITAAGGWTVIKKLFWPSDAKPATP
jgi:hypothetical protein